jgi:hypothetical protein
MWLAPLLNIDLSLPVNTQSWSYRLSSGSDHSAADFRQNMPTDVLDAIQPAKGSILVGEIFNAHVPNTLEGTQNSNRGAGVGRFGQTADTIRFVDSITDLTERGTRYEVIRTGTGSIELAAGRDVQLRNPFATIYTAGAALPVEQVQTGTDSNGNPIKINLMSVFRANDFSLPMTDLSVPQSNLGALQQSYLPNYGLAGGDLFVFAANDIKRLGRSPDRTVSTDSSMQLPTNWLLRRGVVDPVTGLFASINISPSFTDLSASTTWWVDYSKFFQGLATQWHWSM